MEVLKEVISSYRSLKGSDILLSKLEGSVVSLSNSQGIVVFVLKSQGSCHFKRNWVNCSSVSEVWVGGNLAKVGGHRYQILSF